jgi:serine/threonine-protein kinase
MVMPVESDNNLLFGVLALQAGLVDPGRFAEACSAWAARKDTPLADLLVECGILTAAQRARVDQLLKVALHKPIADPRASVETLASDGRQPARAEGADPHLCDTRTPEPAANGSASVASPANKREARQNYDLVRVHATGGIGRVWVARDQELGREVALKELRPDRVNSASDCARFLEEAKITGQLEHPGIVPVYELSKGADAAKPFYTMRLVRGRTLANAIKEFHRPRPKGESSSLALRELLGTFVAVCNTVAYAHARGVIHRDLKPQNVVVGDYGEVIVLDWGLAKVTGRPDEQTRLEPISLETDAARGETVQGQIVGTPAYLAPEQAEGLVSQIDERTDVYGLGAILYEILVGEPPFAGKDALSVLERVSLDKPIPPRQRVAQTPLALQAVCLKALAKVPAQRYTSAKELAQEVQHWLADDPVASYREPLPARLGRWGRRHKVLLSSVAALLLTAVVGLAIGLVAVNTEKRRTQDALAAEQRRRQQTREALDALSSEVIEDWLGKQKELLPEHKAFLEKALASYEEFAQDTSQDEQARAAVAAASRRVGKIHSQLGQTAEAEAAYRHSAELFRRLAADFPDQADYRFELGQSLSSLGVLFEETQRLPEAEAAYREALPIRQQLVVAYPDRSDYRFALANSYDDLAIVMKRSRRPKEAETAFGEAIQLGRQLVADFPDRPDYRRTLALIDNNLAILLATTDRPRDAEPAFRESLTLLNKLVADSPNRAEYRESLAAAHMNFGCMLVKDPSRQKDAESANRQAADLYKQLAVDFPAVPEYPAHVANSLDGLAELALARQHYADACQLLQEALPYCRAALRSNPRDGFGRAVFAENRKLLAQARLALGEHAAAAAAAEEMLPLSDDPAGDAVTVAGLLARCRPLAAKDPMLSDAQRKDLAQRYAERALACLREAIAKGYKDVDHLKADADFASLRSRADFLKLLHELAKP